MIKKSERTSESTDMELSEKLLDLPWQIQWALASGFAAYILAYAGIRGHHNATDTAFRAVMFSLFATAILYLLSEEAAAIAAPVAFFGTIAAGLSWRLWGMRFVTGAMRRSNISWSDDMPSAWATLTANSQFWVSQLGVQLTDGTWLYCSDTRLFRDAPFGPCRIGPTGDIAFYVDKVKGPAEPAKAQESVRDPDHGDRLTYVPGAQIRKVTIRFLKPSVVPGRWHWRRLVRPWRKTGGG